MIECVPAASVMVARCATPLVTVAVPRKLPLSKNDTVPVAAVGVTVAVNVTLPPTTISAVDAVRTVVVLGKPLLPVVPAPPPPVGPPAPVPPLPTSFTTSRIGSEGEPL